MSPILRELIAAQIRVPNTDVDPMTAVARGAAIFASTIEFGDSVQEEQKKEVESTGGSLLQLEAKYEATSVLDEEVVVLKPKPEKSRQWQVAVEFALGGLPDVRFRPLAPC